MYSLADITGALSNRPTVLLVDDDDGVRQLLYEALSRAGYNVLQACDGADAMERAMAHPGDIHVLVTDIIMPHLNGFELARQLQVRREDVKVVFISGQIEAQILAAANPGLVIIRKPFKIESLLAKVREVMTS